MYKSKSDLPETLQDYLPEKLQEIYLEAYQKTWEEYEERMGGEANRSTVAHRNGMMAVQRDYEFDDESGQWHPKGEKPQEEEDKGLIENIKDGLDDLT
jgi:cation transport regulator